MNKLKPTNAPRVVMGKKSLRVNITRADIEQGIERDPNCCVIACAIKREHPELSHVSVDLATIRATDKEKRLRYIWFTPPSFQGVIVATDQGLRKKIKPGSASLLTGQILELPPAGKSRRRKSGTRKRPVAKKRLIRPNGGNNVPIVVGGKEPPVIVGQTRGFGLRSLRV